ncbi:MAG: hypothetical protein IIU55_03245 [Paludibacteraceae bacterium]|nr:hypothetical protein [Paludibacteraceae bacterium]
MITLGNEMIRINSAKNSIEYSTNGGRFWVSRCTSSSYGTFVDLLPYENELLAIYIRNIGTMISSWIRCPQLVV